MFVKNARPSDRLRRPPELVSARAAWVAHNRILLSDAEIHAFGRSAAHAVLTLLALVAQRSSKQHVTLRLPANLKQALSRQASKEGVSQTGLAERYLEEAIRVAEHPGIAFRSGPAGRRPAVIGGPDVWEIVETFLAEGRDVGAAARYLDLPVGLVSAAIGYYADYREEIDDWIGRNRLLVEEAAAAATRRRRVAGG